MSQLENIEAALPSHAVDREAGVEIRIVGNSDLALSSILRRLEFVIQSA